jgi:hypothetical protein
MSLPGLRRKRKEWRWCTREGNSLNKGVGVGWTSWHQAWLCEGKEARRVLENHRASGSTCGFSPVSLLQHQSQKTEMFSKHYTPFRIYSNSQESYSQLPGPNSQPQGSTENEGGLSLAPHSFPSLPVPQGLSTLIFSLHGLFL